MKYKTGKKNKTLRHSKTQLTKGAFGKPSNNVYDKQGNLIISASVNDLGNYKTLKVIPRLKRTKENCNSCGVKNDS